MNKLKLAKKLLKATALALHIKTKLDGPARNKAIYGQVHLKQVTEVEKNLLHALGPFFERQAKSAASKLAKVKNEPNEQQSASELSRQIFNPNDWHEELINRALPPLATSMTKAALAQMAVMGVNVRKLKKAIKNCGTGAGGFKPGNSCARSGGFSATLGSAIADTKRDGRERAFLVFRDGSVSDVHVGDGFSVDTATDPRVYEVGQDIESVHTHPIGASDAKDFGHYTGFSLGDIHTVNQFPGIRKFTVVDLDGSSFTMTRKQSDPDFMKRLWVRTKDVMAEVHQKNLDAFIDGTMSRDELKKAARLESVAVIQKLQSEGFIDYSENLKRADVKSFDSIKASTATEWLENYRGDPADITQSFEDLVFSTPYGDVSMRIATELPTWMKQEIVKHLEQTFSQDYWSGINQTTLDQIEDFLKDGLQNGQSIATMADNIAAALGGENALTRAKNIARTESGNALNGARSLAADGLMEDLAEYNLPMKKVWHSVLGSTTRADHANLDGVPVSSDNTWNLAGYKVRWPGDTVLPPGQRCNCQCTILVDFGMDDETARQLLSEYDERAAKQEKTFREKNCGTGAGGFKPGNSCARSGSVSSVSESVEPSTLHLGVVAMVRDVVKKWKYHGQVNVIEQNGREFERGGVKWKEAGNCHLESGTVTIHSKEFDSIPAVQRLVSHEIMHGVYEKVHTKFWEEFRQSAQEPHKLRASGMPKPEYEHEFPTLTRLFAYLCHTKSREKMETDDGITEYSKAYWQDFAAGNVTHHIAVHETLAEMAAEKAINGKLGGSQFYRGFYRAVADEYKYITNSKKRKSYDPGDGLRSSFVNFAMYLDDGFNPASAENAKYISEWQADGTHHWGVASRYEEKSRKNCGTGAGGFKPGNTCGRTGSPASGVAGKIVADGLAKSANLGDISEDDANSILSGLQKSIQAGGHLLYLKSVQVVDKTPAGHDEGGLGYSGGNLYITKKFLDHAASNNPDTVRQSLTGTGGERNFAWQDGQNKSECIQLAVAHEVGHHVDSGLFIDWGKAVRTSGLNYTESDAVKVSGYASTHPAELFAELHAFNSIGRRDKIPSNLRAIYDTALKTADPEPMFVR